jgi:large subunit ribosomal protein L30
MSRVRITKIKSTIKRPKDQKATMVALGLNKMNSSAEFFLNPSISGMIDKVRHLLKVEVIN